MGMMSVIKILGHVKFMSHSIKLPDKKNASGNKEGWSDKYFKDRDKAEMNGVPQQLPIPFFMPQKSGYKPQQDTCDKIGKDFQDFHDAMLDAIEFAHNQWKLQCKFKDIKVMAVSAIGAPGCLHGPQLESLIKNAPSSAPFPRHKHKPPPPLAQSLPQS